MYINPPSSFKFETRSIAGISRTWWKTSAASATPGCPTWGRSCGSHSSSAPQIPNRVHRDWTCHRNERVYGVMVFLIQISLKFSGTSRFCVSTLLHELSSWSRVSDPILQVWLQGREHRQGLGVKWIEKTHDMDWHARHEAEVSWGKLLIWWRMTYQDKSNNELKHQHPAKWRGWQNWLWFKIPQKPRCDFCVNLPNSCRKLWSAKSSSRRSKLHSASCLPLRERMKTKASARVSMPFSFRALG